MTKRDTEEENTTTDLIEGQITPEEYAAYWGCDPCYDRHPRKPGDGYLFYNFQAQRNEPDFLTQFIPAIDRTIKAITDTSDQKGLLVLKTICQNRLNNPHLVEDNPAHTSYDRSLTNVNGARYNVALSADRSIANVRREDVKRGVTETWELKGQADFVHMLGHYAISNPDAIARDFWLCTE